MEEAAEYKFFRSGMILFARFPCCSHRFERDGEVGHAYDVLMGVAGDESEDDEYWELAH